LEDISVEIGGPEEDIKKLQQQESKLYEKIKAIRVEHKPGNTPPHH
jgi:hypothetical protein